jgi:hypothetical protein
VTLSSDVTFEILFALSYLLSPIVLFWGWARWMRQSKLRTLTAILSLISFVLATASALLGVLSSVYGVIHGFPYYDPLLLGYFGSELCFLLAASGLVSVECGDQVHGAGTPRPLRAQRLRSGSWRQGRMTLPLKERPMK